MKANQIRYQGIVGYPFLHALLDFITSVQDISPQIHAFICRILSWLTFTHFCIGHFPTDLSIILSHFVVKEVYAFVKILAEINFSFPCLSQNLSNTPVPASWILLSSLSQHCNHKWFNKSFFVCYHSHGRAVGDPEPEERTNHLTGAKF